MTTATIRRNLFYPTIFSLHWRHCWKKSSADWSHRLQWV